MPKWKGAETQVYGITTEEMQVLLLVGYLEYLDHKYSSRRGEGTLPQQKFLGDVALGWSLRTW